MKLGALLAASLLFALAAVACSSAEAPAPTTPTAASPTVTVVPPTETPAGPSPTPAPTAVPNVCQANPSPANPANPNVIVSAPVPSAAVTSPMNIAGLANVFEAQVNITLYGELGGVIAETTAMTQEGQTLSPFNLQLPFAVSREQPACLWVYAISPKDGTKIDVVQVQIALVPPAQPSPTVTTTSSPTSTPSQ